MFFFLIEHTRPTYILYFIRSSMIESACLVPYLQLVMTKTLLRKLMNIIRNLYKKKIITIKTMSHKLMSSVSVSFHLSNIGSTQ